MTVAPRAAVARARRRPTRVLVLLGGPDYFSNGIHLNVIEAAPDPADAAWRNLNAMNDLVRDLITLEEKLVVAALAGGAGAGGAILAQAAAQVWARPGAVLNPHYKGMGGLYGSEYWTYLLPRRVGARRALELTEGRLPVGANAAVAMGLIDAAFGADRAAFAEELAAQAAALAAGGEYTARLAAKAARRRRAEAVKPLAAYWAEELAEMHRCFYGPDPAFHESRRRFVHKLGPATQPVQEPLRTVHRAEIDPIVAG
jgi:putative two-component system hydrogenase maturation factor HypX/HoxX